MKKRSIHLAALVFAASISLGSAGFATTISNPNDTVENVEFNNGCHCKRHSFYESDEILKKLGLTEQEIISGRQSGKSIFDLTKAKNLTEKQVKTIIIEEITTSINNKVSVGRISKEEGAKILENKTAQIQNWNGSLEERKREERGFHIPKKLGITNEDIIQAEKDNKSLYDLAKIKGFTTEQVKTMIIEEATTHINTAVEDGKLTKEKASVILSEMKNKVEGWDGKF